MTRSNTSLDGSAEEIEPRKSKRKLRTGLTESIETTSGDENQFDRSNTWQIGRKRTYAERMFGIRRSSTAGGNKFNTDENVVESGPIDEVQGLRSIFSDFFNASAKTLSQ